MYKNDCFAIHKNIYGETSCCALQKIQCENCKFYRSDTSRAKIEYEIQKYSVKG